MPSQTAVAINAKGAVKSYQLEVASLRPFWQTCVRSEPQHFNKGYQSEQNAISSNILHYPTPTNHFICQFCNTVFY